MYVWHKYWSRKTWNVVGAYIDNYCPVNGIVLDPFAGSGVVAVEAARRGRRAIVSDLNPVANLITEITLRPLDALEFQKAFERIQAGVKDRVEKLYEIHCVKCKKPMVCNAFVREGDKVMQVRYPKCPHCGHRCIDCKPLPSDVEALNQLEKASDWLVSQESPVLRRWSTLQEKGKVRIRRSIVYPQKSSSARVAA